jgi:hypothetical protein
MERTPPRYPAPNYENKANVMGTDTQAMRPESSTRGSEETLEQSFKSCRHDDDVI